MAFQAVPNCALVVVRGTYGDGTPLINTYGADITLIGTLTQGDADDFADFFAGAYSILDGFMSTTVSMNDVVVTDLRTEGAPEFISTSSFPVTGDDSGQPLPFQTAALVSWTTELRGRSFRGRTYLGGFVESLSDGKNISSGLITALESYRDYIVDQGVSVISRYHDKEKRDVGTHHKITGGSVNPHWRSQRRRQY